MERVNGAGINGVASEWLLRVGLLAAGLFIPERKLAIISRACWIRLFFFFMTELLLFANDLLTLNW
jgi:hypothetical protein